MYVHFLLVGSLELIISPSSEVFSGHEETEMFVALEPVGIRSFQLF